MPTIAGYSRALGALGFVNGLGMGYRPKLLMARSQQLAGALGHVNSHRNSGADAPLGRRVGGVRALGVALAAGLPCVLGSAAIGQAVPPGDQVAPSEPPRPAAGNPLGATDIPPELEAFESRPVRAVTFKQQKGVTRPPLPAALLEDLRVARDYNGRVISAVKVVEYRDLMTSDQEVYRDADAETLALATPAVKLEAGKPFSEELLAATLAEIAPKFVQVDCKLRPGADDTLEVVLIVADFLPDPVLTDLGEDERALAYNSLRLRPGMAFSRAQVSEDISRLNRLGRFRQVEVKAQQLSDGGVEVVYIVTVQPLITAVDAVGNTILTDQDLAAATEVLIGTPVDNTQLDRAARRIEDQYREKGYANARVTIDEAELEQNGIVLFKIREGDKTRVTEVRYEGNQSFSGRQIGRVIKTSAWRLLNFEKGTLSEEQLDEDVAAIVQFYKDRGHLDARADRVVTIAPNGREAIVTFVIEEGAVYTLRDLKLLFAEGDSQVFTAEQLSGLMTIKPGDVYSDEKLKKSIDAVTDSYKQMGYVDVRVARRELRDIERPEVDLRLEVREGQRFKAGIVEIQGNTITRDDVIRRQVFIEPDRPLDGVGVRRTEDELKRTRLYDNRKVKVTVQAEDEANPGYRDVLVEVAETNTAQFSIGGAASSDSGLTATLSVKQRNFDITDTPDSFGELFRGDAFRGGGQTFSIDVLPGTRVQQYSVGLSDPYLGESDYGGNARVLYRNREYDGYDERRIGTDLSLSRRFGSLWRVSLPFRVQNVQLTAIDADSPTEYFKFEDSKLIDSIGLRLERSSYDNPSFPTRGTRVSFGIDQYGLLGDYTFNKISAEYSKYFKLSEDVLGRATTLQLKTEANYIPGDQDVAPFYERNYLGGSSFRGFDYRAVAPIGTRNDNGQPSDKTIGGNWMFFVGAELRYPIYEQLLSGVFFIDTGTVEDELGFSSYRASVGFGFRVYVEQLSPVPLSFDFGFPVMKEDTDETQPFNFSLDVPFN